MTSLTPHQDAVAELLAKVRADAETRADPHDRKLTLMSAEINALVSGHVAEAEDAEGDVAAAMQDICMVIATAIASLAVTAGGSDPFKSTLVAAGLFGTIKEATKRLVIDEVDCVSHTAEVMPSPHKPGEGVMTEPQTAEEAAGMIDTGLKWLELHAPDKLAELAERAFEGVPRIRPPKPAAPPEDAP